MTVACVGQAIDEHRILIVDENGEPVADRMQGEVVIEGPSVLGGYYKETTANRAFRHNRLYTGDLGYKDGNYLFITGRLKDLIIRAGANLSPYDIERVASQVEGVRAGATAAVGVRDEAQGTELLVVFFETTLEDSGPVAQAIKQTLVQTLGIMPDHVWPLPPHSVEKTTSGKVRRPELAQKAHEYLMSASQSIAQAA
jgi:acyl-CoA synthetase (AMP-forming)/AMP-acid ligase II